MYKGRYCFHRCLSVNIWGGYPIQLTGHIPHPRSRGYPIQHGGTPSSCGVPISDSRWGVLHPAGWGILHPRSRQGYPIQQVGGTTFQVQREVPYPAGRGYSIPGPGGTQLRFEWGTTSSRTGWGYPLIQDWMGYPYPGLDGVPLPHQETAA